MVLASYLHEEKDAKMILPYLEDCMNESYGTEELDYHEAVACCIPYWDMNSEFEKTNNALEIENTNLLAEHMDNTKQIAALRIALNHYRLAFFGLLTIVLAVLVFLAAYKFVRKKRTKV